MGGVLHPNSADQVPIMVSGVFLTETEKRKQEEFADFLLVPALSGLIPGA